MPSWFRSPPSLALLGLALVACGSDIDTNAFGTTATTSTSTASGSGGAAGATSSSATSSSASGNAGGAGGATAVGGGGAAACVGQGDPCTGCMANQCADAYCGCVADPACGALFQCLQACGNGDSGCAQMCLTANEQGISEVVLVGNCAATSCSSACKFGQALTPCELCLYTHCDTVMNACLSNPDCVSLLQCAAQCSPNDAGCPAGCVEQFPNGATDAQAVKQCSDANCASACPG